MAFKRILFGWILMVLFCVAVNAQTAQYQEKINKAQKHIYKKEYDEALLIIEELQAEDELDITALELKITIAIQTDETRDVFKEIENLLRQNPGMGEFYYLRGVLNMHTQKYVKALSDFQSAMAFDVDKKYEVKILLNEGMANLYLHEYEEAEEKFNNAINMDQSNATAYHSLGMLKYQSELYDEAITNFLKALKYEDNNPITYYNLGMAFFKADKTDDACYYFNRSCELGHKNACIMFYLHCAEDKKSK